jgi:hypothetical protein
VDDQNLHRNLNFSDLKNRLVFEHAIGVGSGSSSSSTRSAAPVRASIAQQQQEVVATIKAKAKEHRPRSLQAAGGISFQDFCTNVEVSVCPGSRSAGFMSTLTNRRRSRFRNFLDATQAVYESSDFTCFCDSVDLYVACSQPLEEYHSLVLLTYDDITSYYSGGIDCVCTTPTCDTPPTDCIVFAVSDNSCANLDIAADETPCTDCRICSTASGLVEVEADGCYTTPLGCTPTFLLADVPGPSSAGPAPTSPSSPGPAPTSPSSPGLAPTSPQTSFPAPSTTDAPLTNPPTNPPTTGSFPAPQPENPPTTGSFPVPGQEGTSNPVVQPPPFNPPFDSAGGKIDYVGAVAMCMTMALALLL